MRTYLDIFGTIFVASFFPFTSPADTGLVPDQQVQYWIQNPLLNPFECQQNVEQVGRVQDNHHLKIIICFSDKFKRYKYNIFTNKLLELIQCLSEEEEEAIWIKSTNTVVEFFHQILHSLTITHPHPLTTSVTQFDHNFGLCQFTSEHFSRKRRGVCPGLVVMGGDTCCEGYRFESHHSK